MIRVLAASVLALGFAGTALADRGHDHDRGRYERYEHDHRHDRRYERPRNYRPAPPPPRYQQRWRAARPHGWHPGWREPYGRGNYRYWDNGYYYVVPGPPSLGLSVTIPLR